jgi:hypothetical protein
LPWQLDGGAPTLRDSVIFLLLGPFAGLGHWFVITAYLLAGVDAHAVHLPADDLGHALRLRDLRAAP